MRFLPHDYQKYAIEFVEKHTEACLLLEMGLGKTIIPTVIVIMGSCVFRVVWIYTIFAYFGTIQSLYLLYGASWVITAIAEITYFLWIYRRSILINPLPPQTKIH